MSKEEIINKIEELEEMLIELIKLSIGGNKWK